MMIPNPAGLIALGKTFLAANRPEILFGASIVSTLSGFALAAKAGWDSRGQVADAEWQRVADKYPGTAVDAVALAKAEPENRLTRKEIVELTWMNYLPSAGLAATAIASTTALHLVHVKEKKQLAAATILAVEQVKKEADSYRKDITESLGLAKSDDPKALEKAAKQSTVANAVNSDGEIEQLYMVRDMKTQRDFWRTRLQIDEAMLSLNQALAHDDVALNEFYSRVSMAGIPDGEMMTWSAGTVVGLEWDTTVTDAGRPIRTFRFSPEPDLLR